MGAEGQDRGGQPVETTTGRTVGTNGGEKAKKLPTVDGANDNKLGGIKKVQICLPTLPLVVRVPTVPNVIVPVGVRSERRLSTRPLSHSTHNNK